METYPFSDLTVHHFDLYRLAEPEELEYMGIRDYFGEGQLCVMEWPERGAGILPQPDVVVQIAPEGRGRKVVIQAANDKGLCVIKHLQP